MTEDGGQKSEVRRQRADDRGIRGFRCRVSGVSAADGLKSGQFNRERNFEKANNEYRTRNNEPSSGGFAAGGSK
jgi:hypothetical protein